MSLLIFILKNVLIYAHTIGTHHNHFTITKTLNKVLTIGIAEDNAAERMGLIKQVTLLG